MYLGIDLGGSFIKYGLIDEEGTILSKDKIATQRTDPEKVMNSLTKIILTAKKTNTINGVGISIPGVVNRENRLVTSGALQGLYRYDVRKILMDKTGMAVRLVNDANAIGYAEKWLGAGKTCQNFVCLPLGTGVGGSIILDGKVIQGRIGASGEFGMMLMGLGKKEPVGYESASYYCGSVAGLCRIYNRKMGRTKLEDWETDIKRILLCAKEGQKEALESIEEFYKNVAVLLLNITVSLDPEQILIGGGISENEEIMAGITAALKDLVNRYTDMSAIGLPKVTPCQLRNTAGMIGAVSQFIEGEKSK